MMSNSSFCLHQRQQEEQKSRRYLLVGLISSLVLHAALGVTSLSPLKKESKIAKDPIDVIILAPPESPPEAPKPKPTPTKIVPPPLQNLPTQPPKKPKTSPAKIQKSPSRPASAPPPSTRRTPRPQPRSNASKPIPSTPPVLTSPQPSALKIPPASNPAAGINPVPNDSLTPSSTRGDGQTNGSNPTDTTILGNPDANGGDNPEGTSTQSARTAPEPEPPKPTPRVRPKVGSCVDNCQVKYPDVLNGAEGRASVRITVNPQGKVIQAEIAKAHTNPQINEQAILAAKRMKFAARSGEDSASTKITINFTVAGSEFDRRARERQEQRERQARAEQERLRQLELEKLRQAQQQNPLPPSAQEPTPATENPAPVLPDPDP